MGFHHPLKPHHHPLMRDKQDENSLQQGDRASKNTGIVPELLFLQQKQARKSATSAITRQIR